MTTRALSCHTVAGIDLGSNSFHMLVVRGDGSTNRVLGEFKDTVGLAGGLDERQALSAAARGRGLASLERFGRVLAAVPRAQVRAVGTHTLRCCSHADLFLGQASRILGQPVEVISGDEEARLMYHGVVSGLADDTPRRLVVDIGGGSTELVVGRGRTPRALHSLSLGAVAYMQRYFTGGYITRSGWREAVRHTRHVLAPLAAGSLAAEWDIAVGVSGSIESLLHAAGLEADRHAITRQMLYALAETSIGAGHIDRLDLPRVSSARRHILPGALAILTGVFESLELETMAVSNRSLRDGIVAELFERLQARQMSAIPAAAPAGARGQRAAPF